MESKRKVRKATPAWLIAAVVIFSIVVIGGFAISAATAKPSQSPVGFGLQFGGGPGLYLVDELKCDGTHRHCSGVVANITGQRVANLMVVIGWKDVEPQTVRVGWLPSGEHAKFSLTLASSPEDIRDFVISFTDG